MKPCCLKLAMCFLFTWTLIDSSVQCAFFGEQSVLSRVQCWLSGVQCAECSWLCGVQLCSRRRRVGCGGRIRPAASHYLLHSAQPSHLNCIQPAGFPQHTKHCTHYTQQTAHTTHCSLTVHTAHTTDMSHSTPDYTVCYTFYLTSNFLNCHCLKLTKGENRAAAQIFFHSSNVAYPGPELEAKLNQIIFIQVLKAESPIIWFGLYLVLQGVGWQISEEGHHQMKSISSLWSQCVSPQVSLVLQHDWLQMLEISIPILSISCFQLDSFGLVQVLDVTSLRCRWIFPCIKTCSRSDSMFNQQYGSLWF